MFSQWSRRLSGMLALLSVVIVTQAEDLHFAVAAKAAEAAASATAQSAQ